MNISVLFSTITFWATSHQFNKPNDSHMSFFRQIDGHSKRKILHLAMIIPFIPGHVCFNGVLTG